MKMNKLAFPLALALAVTFALTGCKKGPTKVIQLPGQTTNFGNDNPSTIPPGSKYNNDQSPYDGSKPIPTDVSSNWPDVTQDPAALAAYTVHFTFDSAAVKDNEKGNIASVAQALNSDQNARLIIEGNCDERGTEKYNLSLGERRALSAREYLANLGMDPQKIKTVTYGASKPADPGHDESAWKKNRRDDMILVTPNRQ